MRPAQGLIALGVEGSDVVWGGGGEVGGRHGAREQTVPEDVAGVREQTTPEVGRRGGG
jgi:hypothetical protein